MQPLTGFCIVRLSTVTTVCSSGLGDMIAARMPRVRGLLAFGGVACHKLGGPVPRIRALPSIARAMRVEASLGSPINLSVEVFAVGIIYIVVS